MERSSGSRPRTTQGRLVGVLLEAGTSAGEITRFLSTATFFDLRQVHGALDVEERLWRVIHRAAGSRQFLGRLAAAALRRRPSPGFPGHLRGEHRGRFDFKAHGIAPIVDLARLLALEAGSHATATVARLRAAAEHGTAGKGTAADLAAAFEYRQQLRLGHQTSRLATGTPPDVIALAEESVRIAYRVDLIA